MIVVAPSVVYHYHVFVFYGHHCPTMTDVHCEYLSVLHLALFLVSQRAHQYFEDNLKESSVMFGGGKFQSTFFHVRTTTKEASCAICTSAPCFDGTTSNGGVLIQQVSVLSPTTLAKVLYLHDCWE